MATCSATDDCDKPAFRRGWCAMHYERWKSHGDFTTVKKPGKARQLGNCSYGDCDRPSIARDLCTKHYQRWKKFGDPGITKLDRDLTPEERFWAKVDKNGPLPEGRPELGPCWLWTAALREGYAAFTLDGGHVDGHRVAYRWLIGEIPEGLQLDHICHSDSTATCAGGKQCVHRRCVNPVHMEPVTGLTNVMRGLSPHAVNAAKTHCPKNHDYTPENTRYDKNGGRVCIKCARAACLAWYYRQKKASPPRAS
jgi:hypothetical protein